MLNASTTLWLAATVFVTTLVLSSDPSARGLLSDTIESGKAAMDGGALIVSPHLEGEGLSGSDELYPTRVRSCSMSACKLWR